MRLAEYIEGIGTYQADGAIVVTLSDISRARLKLDRLH